MTKLSIEIDSKQLEGLVEKLPLADKIHLARRLNIETWQIRFKNLLNRIDRRVKGRKGIPDERIVQIVKRVRKRNYAHSHN